MIKRVTIFRTRPGLTLDELRAWWPKHQAMALDLPKLRGYVTNLAVDELYSDPGINGIKGIAELWFDNREDLDKALDFNRPQRKAIRSHSEPIISARTNLIMEETVLIKPPYT